MHVRTLRAAAARAERLLVALFSTAAAADTFAYYFFLLDGATSARQLRQLHGHLLRVGLLADVVLGSKLVRQYSRHGELLSSAYPFFLGMPLRNHYSFSIVIGEMSRAGHPRHAAELFIEMRASGLPLDAPTAALVLRSYGAVRCAAAGAAAHGLCTKHGLERNPYVASAAVFLYAALGRLPDARALFDETPQRDAVLWTAMLSGYAQRGPPEAAVEVFSEMVATGMELDGVTIVGLLLASSRLGYLLHGKSAHGFVVRRGIPSGLSLGNALVDMYAKCGDLLRAEEVFRRMPRRDVISWSSLILGHGLHGGADRALELFSSMAANGVRPNAVTFLGVLSACAHAGRVNAAWGFWEEMTAQGVAPELKHYACMVDVLARAGRLGAAERFAAEMPVEPDEAVWGALLAACRTHGEVEAAERVARRLLRMRPEKSGYYVLLANVFSDAGRYSEAEKVKALMKELNVGKLPGHSSVDLS